MKIYFFIPSHKESILRKAQALSDHHNLQKHTVQIPVNHSYIISITCNRRIHWLRQKMKNMLSHITRSSGIVSASSIWIQGLFISQHCFLLCQLYSQKVSHIVVGSWPSLAPDLPLHSLATALGMGDKNVFIFPSEHFWIVVPSTR